MRLSVISAVVFSVVTLAANCAVAEEWCGYADRAKAMIECGYSTASDCATAIGKGATCFVDPDYALNARRRAPSWPGLSRPSTILASQKY